MPRGTPPTGRPAGRPKSTPTRLLSVRIEEGAAVYWKGRSKELRALLEAKAREAEPAP